ncbi:glycoside hydrolase family 16 protein [Nakamurella antarctica]|uniref:glycoside hydrolase family 16 protein n=1 Tax=Nakamurella antarctica TaxID=1902245 RepID=UPI0019D17A92|nr:glycoside hydrolase family 16 protein [Nakamurella antarctica]
MAETPDIQQSAPTQGTNEQVAEYCLRPVADLLPAGSQWSWQFDKDAPPSTWSAQGFDDSAWSVGPAPLGFVAKGIATDVSAKTTRPGPRVAYFRSKFEAPKLPQGASIVVNTVADDGLILYVNGQEIGRSNVISGPDSHDLFASSSFFGPVTYTIPASLLRVGTNDISASVHLNFRATRAISFDARVQILTPDFSTPPQSEACPIAATELLAAGSTWSWQFKTSAPGGNWAGVGFDDSAWSTGPAPLGFAAKGVVSNIAPKGVRPGPRVAYFRSDFTAPALSGTESVVVNTVADDGVVMYVNGVEVGRSNVIAGPDSNMLFASTSYKGPVSFDIPVALIHEGQNTISASVHLNYRATRAVAFDAEIEMLTPAAAPPAAPTSPTPESVAPSPEASASTEPPTTAPATTTQINETPTSSAATALTSESPLSEAVPQTGAQTTGAQTTGAQTTGAQTTGAQPPVSAVPAAPAASATSPETIQVSGASSAAPSTTISLVPATSSTLGAPPPADPAVLANWGAPVFRDEFNATTVDSTKWRVRDKTRLAYDQAIISASQVKVANGNLSIATQWLANPVLGTERPRYFNTGYIDTIGLFSQRYGRWEMRAKLPLVTGASRGIWPAFWLRDSRGLGEIDIMEAIGAPHDQMGSQPEGTFSSTVHQSTNHEAGTVRVSTLNKKLPTVIGGYHTWALEWDPAGMRFYYDGALVWAPTTKDNPWFNTAFTDAGVNIRIDTQVGFWWMGYADPLHKEWTTDASYDIDYVRVWKYNP